MTRHKPHFIAKWPELAGNRVDQLLMVPAREIGPADGALEQDVTNKSERAFFLIDHNMARRMARTVCDAEFCTRQLQLVAIMKILVRSHIAAISDAVFGALSFQFIQQPLIVLVGANDRAAVRSDTSVAAPA